MNVVKEFFGVRSSRIPMPDSDAVLLTPFRQWRVYKSFPLSVALHAVVMILITLQALMLSSQFIAYNRANEHTLREHFFLEDYRDGVYSISETLEVLEQLVENYYSFPDKAVDAFAQFTTEEEDGTRTVVEPVLKVKRYKDLTGPFWDRSVLKNDIDDEDISGDFHIETTTYSLSRTDPLGDVFPLDQSKLAMQTAIYHVVEMELEFALLGVNVGQFGIVPQEWIVKLYFHSLGGKVDFTMLVLNKVLRTSGLGPYDVFGALSILLFISSLFVLLLSIRGMTRSIWIWLVQPSPQKTNQAGEGLALRMRLLTPSQRTRRKYVSLCKFAVDTDPFPTWDTVPIDAKLHFFSFWFTIDFVSGVAILIASSLGIAEDLGWYFSSTVKMIIYGIGCLLMSISICRYLEYNKRCYLFFEIIRNGVEQVAIVMLSASPLFWAYVLFGVLNFAPYSEKFQDIDETTVSLFSMIAGDDIHPTFNSIVDGAYPVPAVSRVYIYTFVVIFITTVQNLFIAIFENAYHLSKALIGLEAMPEDYVHSSALLALKQVFANIERWEARLQEMVDTHGASFELEPVPSSDLLFTSVANSDTDSLLENEGASMVESSASGADSAVPSALKQRIAEELERTRAECADEVSLRVHEIRAKYKRKLQRELAQHFAS